jgi:hypothetical protein
MSKGNYTMKTIRNIALGVVVFALFACDHPFKAGLGPVEDIRPPTVTLENPGAGDYISGETVFSGAVEDDYRLVSVEMMVVNYPEKTELDYCQDFVKVNVELKVNRGKWDYPIDTTLFPDGDLKIRLRATDSVNKIAVTDPIVFMVNNSLPAIAVSLPYIERGIKDGNVGGPHLNYETVDGSLPVGLTFQRQMNKGGSLSGTISHDEDIYLGQPNAAANQYPPQIRVWRIEDDAAAVDSWKPGVLPPESAVPWRTLSLEDDTLMGVTVGLYQFMYPVPAEVGCFYGFEIRAQTKNGRAHFHYPRDYYPPRDWNANGSFEKENRYVLFFVRTPRELPTLELYGLEDISGKDGWTGSAYKDLVVPENHPYVDKESVSKGKVNKNGDFILRYKAYHTEGIRSAEIYWEKEDRSERGRFIWDLANAAPPDYPSWNNSNNVAESNPYSFWGHRDQNVANTRNFIFTYRHRGTNRMPGGTSYHEQVRGSSTIQRYKGNQSLWSDGKKDGQWPLWSRANADNIWEDMTELSEGKYTIEVYTRSVNDMAKTNPVICSILLDRKGPEVEITLIEGVRDFNPTGVTTVNGVIRPQMRIVEPRPQDSGLRTTTDTSSTPYFKPFEQRYIVITKGNGADRTALEALINGTPNWWPDPANDVANGINSAALSGPVESSTFRFKTSNIYSGTSYTNRYGQLPEGLSLAPSSVSSETSGLDNGNYYLYVFARDNAFNVSHTSIEFEVDHLADFPYFEFASSGMTFDVTKPSQSYDNTSDGFRQANGTVRNKLSPGSSIRFRLRDDDSLDLGAAGTGSANESKVEIKFAGSTSTSANAITTLPTLTLTDAMIKNIFVVQPSDSNSRSAVRERTGDIDQGKLLEVLKGANRETINYNANIPGLANYTSLPDGLYQFTITAADYAPAKLTIPTQHGGAEAAVAKRTAMFWIAVDNAGPDISHIDTASGSSVLFKPDPANSGYSMVTVKGIVSDQNGPITAKVTVRKAGGGTVDYAKSAIDLTRAVPGNSVLVANPTFWVEDFAAKIVLKDTDLSSETYVVTLEFTDRFNTSKSVELRYTYDKDPPQVAALTKMKTFARTELRVRDPNSTATPKTIVWEEAGAPSDEELVRLANGILSFSFTARDDGKVTEARWWLVPDNSTATTPNTNKPTGFDHGFTGTEAVNTTLLLNMGASMNTDRKGGRIDATGDFSGGKTWFIDTTGLANGRYTLYAAAKDEANNTSAITELQTIYVLQPHDIPWFGSPTNIKPNEGSGQGVIGASGAVIRGYIYEDDGFDASDNYSNAIAIYMSKNENAASVSLASAPTANSTYGYVKGTLKPGMVAKSGSSNNLALQIDLRTITEFNDIMSGDGKKYYVIEAQDSWQGKFTTETGTLATGATSATVKMNRKVFSFVYDFKDPVITITSPVTGDTFGNVVSSGAKPFLLTGTITDAYLDVMENIINPSTGFSKYQNNKNYYILWRFGPTGDFVELNLGAGGADIGGRITGNTIVLGERIVTFTVPETVFPGLFNYDSLPSGTHSLSFQVKDESGKIGQTALSFLKDMDPPSFTFTNINKRELPPISAPNDWWIPANTLKFKEKRAALEALSAAQKLSVLQYDGNAVTIEGTFTDVLSNINKASFKYYLDENTTGVAVPSGAIEGEGKNVSWKINLVGIKDGVHSLRIEVADAGGNTLQPGNIYYGFVLVSQKPAIAITKRDDIPPLSPASVPPVLIMGDYSAAGKTPLPATDPVFVISGTASSPSLADVKLKISLPGYTTWSSLLSKLITAPATVFDENTFVFPSSIAVHYLETGNWSYTFTRDALYKATGLTSGKFREGTYELSAVAIDQSGAESEEVSWSFIVDSGKPKVEFTTPGKILNDTANPDTRKPAYWLGNLDNRNVIMSDTPRLQASISDPNGLGAAQYQIRKFNYGSGATGAWGDFYNGTTGAIVTEANSWIDITGIAGTTDSAWALPIALDDGYYYVRVRARDASVLYKNGDTDKVKWEDVGDGNPGTSLYGYFFLARKSPDITHGKEEQTTFSSRVIPNNQLSFDITATDLNWFQKLDVKVVSRTGTPYTSTIPSVTLNTAATNAYGDVAVGWERSVSIPFPVSLQDGRYEITFTVTDLAGRSSEKTRTITLDNTAPIGTIERPQNVNLGTSTYPPHVAQVPVSATLYGGEATAEIGGTTDDKGANGSASGVAHIWYHLGYVAKTANNEYTNNDLAFPTEATLRTTVAGTVTIIDGSDRGGDDNNKLFDDAAKDVTTAWFKYEAGYDTPYGVVPLPVTGNIDKINWGFIVEKSLGEIANYAKKDFKIKDGAAATVYNLETGGNRSWMVKKINPSLVPTTLRKNGLYSLPLWVRVADNAGNVSYFCKDIWLYPNGDYPSNSFSNPDTDLGSGSPKGGQFSIEGVASDNISVKKVIYRVFADNVNGAGWDNTSVRPADSKIVYLTGLSEVPSAEFTSIPDYAPTATNNNPFGAGKLSTVGWYYATLESGTPAPTMPWSIIVNAQNEITDVLNIAGGSVNGTTATTGRWFDSGGSRFTRLYIEVFAFDGNDSGANSYNKISLGGDDEKNPKPDVRILYVTSSAPAINTLRLSNTNAYDSFTDTTLAGNPAAGSFSEYDRTKNLRSKRFAVRMNLSSGSTARNIAQISVRRSGGGENSGWKEVWRTGNTLNTNTILTGEGAGIHLNGSNAQAVTMTYAFNSFIKTSASNFAPVLDGKWEKTGGTFTIEVQIKDTANPPGEATARFDIAIDNFTPVADNRDISKTPGKVAGTNASFIGRVFDYQGATNAADPAHRSIDRVLAWFTTNADGKTGYINLTGNTGATSPATMLARKGRTADVLPLVGDNVTSVTLANEGGLPESVEYPSGANYLKTLSASTGGIQANQIIWQPTGGDQDILWNFITDTTKMPDGRIYLNYLVVDTAGNASYYQQTMVVMNKYPQITNVTLRTDNMGVGAVFTTHSGDVAEETYSIPDTPFESGYLDSGFISKNRFIAFGVDTMGGNAPLNYRVQYVKRIGPFRLSNANLKNMADKTYGTGAVIGNTSLYTIANKGNADDYAWVGFGVPVARPTVGTHFVFQATNDDVKDLADYSVNTTVYGYQVVDTGITKTALNRTGNNANTITIDDQLLYFKDGDPTAADTYFGAAKIAETDTANPTAYFLIKVWDSVTTGAEDDMLYDAVVVGMKVFLSDKTDPTARLYDLNPYTETAVVNNNLNPGDRTDTIANAADPIAIGSNILRGGLFNVKTERDMIKSGYVDPRSGTTALRPDIQDPNTLQWRATNADGFVSGDSNNSAGSPDRDKVSGRVILRGLAWDDQFVNEIRIKIGDNTEKVILKLTDLDAAGNPTTVTANITKREMRAASGVQAFAYEELHWKNGHTVEWAYVWDTEEEPASAGGRYQNGVPIAVRVIDRNASRPSTSVATDNTTTRVYHNTISVDIVPYVVGFERASQYSTTRSRQGWYSFFQGEPGIALLGYNLGTAAAAPGIAYATTDTGGTTMGNIAIDDVSVATRPIFPRRYTFTVPAAAVSGKINVTVTGAAGVTPATSSPAYNTNFATAANNYTTKSWNRENSAYIAGSDLWINRPHVHIWRTTENAAAPRTYFNGSGGPTSPGMALEYESGAGAGRLHAAWTSFGDATYYYGHNGADSRVTMQGAPSGDPFALTDISLFNGAGTPNLSAVYQNDGAPYVLLRTTLTTNGIVNQEHRNARISYVASGVRASERWGNTRIAKAAANTANNPNDPYREPGDIANNNRNPGGNDAFWAGRTYMTAYDSQNKYLWFGMRYNTGTNNAHNNYTRIIDGVTANADDTTLITGGLAAGTNKGDYNAVDFDGTGPVIAYYDQANDTVRIAFGTLATTGTDPISGWSRQYLLPSTHALYKGSGKYISLKVDKANGIHLAFYNSIQQTVVYAYMENRNTPVANVVAYPVDKVIQGGVWTDISVDDNGSPWIVYGNTSRMNNYDGVRMAYKSSANTGFAFATTRESTNPAAGWEAVSMPADYTIRNDRLNIEVWPPTNRAGGTLPTGPGWNAAIGYGSDMYRIGYFYYPGYKGY